MIKREELTNPSSCMSRAKDDEMTFVLLARDKAAPDAIRYWAWRRIDLGKNTADDPQIKEALECARTMDRATEGFMMPQEKSGPSAEPEKCLPEGCGYQGYEFGAAYPDSLCCGGRLYDADNCDGNGNLYEPAEDIPCPMCREQEAIDYWADRNSLSGIPKAKAREAARCLVADIRRNREKGTEPWKRL